MKCNEIQDLFGNYWDLPEQDEQRILVNDHLARCAACREEFEFWKESADLIQVSALVADQPLSNSKLTKSVMERIYTDESWRLPVNSRSYRFGYKLRRNIFAVLAFCMVFFMASFIYSIVSESNTSDVQAFIDSSGLLPSTDAMGDGEIAVSSDYFEQMPVASISDPIMLQMGPITYPDYLVAVSLLGLITVLLMLNWFSRTRA
jgi:hypothetical protein